MIVDLKDLSREELEKVAQNAIDKVITLTDEVRRLNASIERAYLDEEYIEEDCNKPLEML